MVTRKQTKRANRNRARRLRHELTPLEKQKALAILAAEKLSQSRSGRVADRRDRKRRAWLAAQQPSQHGNPVLESVTEITEAEFSRTDPYRTEPWDYGLPMPGDERR